MKILVLVGHPDNECLNVELGNAYAEGARKAGAEVRRVNLADLHFDPILHKGYKVVQELEPDLKKLQEDIRWCNHFVIFYPSWWSTMPALLKGLFDRMWLPGFAYRFKQEGFGAGYLWEKLLKGRTARVFVTSDSPALIARLMFGDNTNEIRQGILGFAGIRASVHKIGGLKNISEKAKTRLLNQARQWGSLGY